MRLIFVSLLILMTTGCTIIRSGESSQGKRWVWIFGMPSKVEIEGITADNRIISIALDSINVDK